MDSRARTRNQLRVCLVAPRPPPYGGIGHWTELVLAHAEQRRDLEIKAIDISPRWRAFHDLSVWKRLIGGGAQLAGDIFKLARTVSTWRPDVIHLTTSGRLAVMRDVLVALLARATRTPLVYHIRFGRLPAIAAKNTWEWRIMLTVLRLSAAAIPIDECTEAAILQHVPQARVTRIPNCIDLATLPKVVSLESSNQSRVAMFLGWVMPEKGIRELLDAWSMASAPNWHLIVVGPVDPTFLVRLKTDCSMERVEFTGEVNHTRAMELMAKADLFVFPSHTEGFPNAVLEAMALGRAIVATDVGAIPEMLKHDCGLLVRAKSTSDLAAALERLVSSESLRRQMGDRARERASSIYSLESVFEQYMVEWQSCVVLSARSGEPSATR